MKKRMISWGLAAAAALSLTACSSGQTGESTSTAESTTAAQTTAAETTEAKQEGVSGTFTGSSAGM